MDIQKLRCAPVIGGVRCQNGEIMKLTESEAKLKLSLLNLSVMGLDSNADYLSINILTNNSLHM
ncbi:hypothetical protein BMR04_08815 [Methylococcaceae bacterium HT3]|nr:hypothetical protein BMR04_08815 [Methylococcaceae bacterium HT3]